MTKTRVARPPRRWVVHVPRDDGDDWTGIALHVATRRRLFALGLSWRLASMASLVVALAGLVGLAWWAAGLSP